MPSARAEDVSAKLRKALLGAGIVADVLIDPLGGFVSIQALAIEATEELALRIEAGTEARVIHA